MLPPVLDRCGDQVTTVYVLLILASTLPQLGRRGSNGGACARPPKIDVETLYLLYLLLFMTMWMSSFRLRSPALATCYIPAFEALITVCFFAFVAVQLQVLLAIALSEKPSPAMLPPAVSQWIMALCLWLLGVLYYMNYASMSAGYTSYWGLIMAGVASVVSLAMTIYNMLQRPVFA